MGKPNISRDSIFPRFRLSPDHSPLRTHRLVQITSPPFEMEECLLAHAPRVHHLSPLKERPPLFLIYSHKLKRVCQHQSHTPKRNFYRLYHPKRGNMSLALNHRMCYISLQRAYSLFPGQKSYSLLLLPHPLPYPLYLPNRLKLKFILVSPDCFLVTTTRMNLNLFF